MLPLASSTWDKNDIEAASEVIGSQSTSIGTKVKQFEKEFAEYHGSKFAVMVNSGSSANLIAMSALHWSGMLEKKEIIVPAVSWATTYYPANQLGYKLVFVDIDADTLNINTEAVEKAINSNTSAVLSVNLLGNPADYEYLINLCNNNNLILNEDNCESLGAVWQTSKTGTLGLMGTFSFFFSHHINTMEGGMIITNDSILDDYMRSLRSHGWIRDVKDLKHLTSAVIEPSQEKFSFVLPEYNLRPTEVQAALGSTQLQKLDNFIMERRKNAKYLFKLFKDNPELQFRLQKENEKSSWFGFAIIAENESLKETAIYKLNQVGVETRPIVTGNFLNQPVIKHLDFSVVGGLTGADEVHRRGFFIGNHHYSISKELEQVVEILKGLSS